MTLPFGGKIALVTGGSRGIGAAIVRRLAHDGATVAFTYASSEAPAAALVDEIKSAGGRALAIRADSADVVALRQAVDEVAQLHGRLDILVNNAGLLTHGLVDDYPLETFDRMVAVNVRAAFAAVQAALPHMGMGGRVITTGSVAANRTAFPGASVYSMTKGAVAAMTRGMAIDLAPRGITVNAIQPGPTATDMVPTDPAVLTRLMTLMPIGRLGKDSEIASLVAYLAGPEAGFITGACLTIDGGYTA
ncbi:3-oxoacyl-ACP reductase family protein [Nitrospirillum amazonense]|uniref:3-oxoacyl-ACP reductase family protein n=1 Tax=Nitrospirillum amazonense TaxID=28077 RepID=UPI0024127334|nr:3-oxoacyl-ACP reductase family protein [Nitrospirillum amazonense]MDG3442605.1 3-oxoacyl-ACP reductase FabG [Nitrospirillum amazonense]